MPNNLTGTNISDTYQKLVQVENGLVSDGTGSTLPISFNSDGVTITGTLHANAISSSRVTSSVIYTSGSSTFGDQTSDTHTFTGAITGSGLQIPFGGNKGANLGGAELAIYETDASDRYGARLGSTNTYGYMLQYHNAVSKVYINANPAVNSYIDAANFGIGTTNPTDKLSVTGTCGISSTLDVGSTFTALSHTNHGASHAAGHTDRHTFIGDISASRHISASGHIKTSEIRGAGAGTAQLNVAGQITASGNISSSGTIYGLSLDIARDTNASAEIGRAHVGHMGHSDYAGFSHVDKNTTGDYALLQRNTGETFVNASSGQPLNFRINNGNKGRFTSGGEFELSYGLDVQDGYHITASGNISASGKITTDKIYFQSLLNPSSDYLEYNGTGLHYKGSAFINSHLTASGNISSSGYLYGSSATIAGTLYLGGENRIDYNNDDIRFLDTGINVVGGHITASNNISASGDIKCNVLYSKENRAAEWNGTTMLLGTYNLPTILRGSITTLNNGNLYLSHATNGHITASGNIKTAGTITASRVYDNTLYQFETTARGDTNDDDHWQGPNGYGIHTRADWNNDFGNLYSTLTGSGTATEITGARDIRGYNTGSRTIQASRLLMNTGWRIPNQANYSCSIKSIDFYVAHNTNDAAIEDDIGFSCSMWYSNFSDLIGNINNVGNGSQGSITEGQFVQRHLVSVDSSQFKADDDAFFKYHNYYVSASNLELNLAPGSMIYPRIKTFGTTNFQTNVHFIINYTKTPL